MRDIYENAKLGEITQGSVFAGALSDTYVDVDCYGVVITARCSIDHGKMQTYHYLPIVPIKEWKKKDFLRLLKDEVYNEYMNRIKSLFRDLSISTKILEQFSLETIKSTISPKISKLTQQHSFIQNVNVLIALENSEYSSEMLNNWFPKGRGNIVKRLLANNYLSYYLIESWDPKIDSNFIILLDEIRTIQKNDFFQLAKGLDYSYWIGNDRCKHSDLIKLTTDDILYVHSCIKSPFIEHIIQRFSHNFNRVGVQDYHESVMDQLINKL